MRQEQQKGIIRTKMAAALLAAVQQCNEDGRSAGRVGRNVVTADAQGVGIKYVPRVRKEKK